MPEISIDNEFQSIIPPLTSDEYHQLEANIVSEGCRDALVIWRGALVDGHNRYKICKSHNIPFRVEEKEFGSRDDAICWIIRNQFGRRNLSPGDRSILALRLEPIMKEKAKERQREHGGTAPGKTLVPISAPVIESGKARDQVAKLAGVGHNTIDKVKKILDKGTPEQVKRIREGGKGNTVNAVYREVIPQSEPATPTAFQKPSPEEFKRIHKETVAHLKSEDTRITAESFIIEYEGFAEETVHKCKSYELYTDVYSILDDDDRKKIAALNTAMLEAIHKIDDFQKGNKP